MSSEKTPNLNLHNWVPTDFVEMEEFNENFKKLDSMGGITEQLTEQVESVDTAVEKKVKTVAFVSNSYEITFIKLN